MSSNLYHLSLEALPDWQRAYIQQYKRVHNRDAGFVPRENGWFELKREGHLSARVHCHRESEVRAMTEDLENESRWQGDDPADKESLPPGLLAARALAGMSARPAW